MNDIYASVAEKTFGVEYIDAYKLLSNGGGRYSQYLPDASGKMQQVRELDGEHLTYAGGLRVAQAVVDAIKKEWFAKKGDGPTTDAQVGQVGHSGALTGLRLVRPLPDRTAGWASPPAAAGVPSAGSRRDRRCGPRSGY